jgi:hypothetical protein
MWSVLLTWKASEDYDKERGVLMFDRNTMKSVEPHDEDEPTYDKQVEILISPGLFKKGDADGEKFDVFSIIEPSLVMWNKVQGTPLRRSAAIQTIESRGLPPLHLGSNVEQPQPQPRSDAQQKPEARPPVEDETHDSVSIAAGMDPMDLEQAHEITAKQELVEDSSSNRHAPAKQKKSDNIIGMIGAIVMGSQVDKRHH